MMPEKPLKVGDQLWFVGEENVRSMRWKTITAVGRKWITLEDRHKAHRDDLRAEGFPYGQYYCTKEEWEKLQAIGKLWSRFRDLVYRNYRCPEHLEAEDVERAITIITGPICREVQES